MENYKDVSSLVCMYNGFDFPSWYGSGNAICIWRATLGKDGQKYIVDGEFCYDRFYRDYNVNDVDGYKNWIPFNQASLVDSLKSKKVNAMASLFLALQRS